MRPHEIRPNRQMSPVAIVVAGCLCLAAPAWGQNWWSPLRAGLNAAPWSQAVFDDGSGPALYVGGAFNTAGRVNVNRIAKWGPGAPGYWSPLGSWMSGGISGLPFALTVFDDGSGPALYAGGWFSTAGGVSASNIARWDGTAWSPLGSGVAGGFASVWALAVFDDGSGPALYAGGDFGTAGGAPASNIARWDGSSWSPLGSGVAGGFAGVRALAVFDDGSGPALYAGGEFGTAGGVRANRIARWDGSLWSPLRLGISLSVNALTVFDDGSGPALYAGGRFTTAGGVSANRIARWDGSSWVALGAGLNDTVHALAAYDDGSGPALYAGGAFTTAGGVSADRIARWDGSSWSALGAGLDDTVRALAAYDDGSGPALYAGGDFHTAGGVSADHIARWGSLSACPCSCDFDPDPACNIFDFLAFQTLFVAGDPCACQQDPDPHCNIFDFLAWQTQFITGCS